MKVSTISTLQGHVHPTRYHHDVSEWSYRNFVGCVTRMSRSVGCTEEYLRDQLTFSNVRVQSEGR